MGTEQHRGSEDVDWRNYLGLNETKEREVTRTELKAPNIQGEHFSCNFDMLRIIYKSKTRS